MNILIAAIGKISAREAEGQIIAEYSKRLQWKVRIIEKSDSLLGSIPKDYLLVALDETGVNLTSREFASYISNLQIQGKTNLAFAIGAADGHTPELIKRSDYVLSLGKITLPHKLARAVLIEQLYRAQTIISGHPYHK